MGWITLNLKMRILGTKHYALGSKNFPAKKLIIYIYIYIHIYTHTVYIRAQARTW